MVNKIAWTYEMLGSTNNGNPQVLYFAPTWSLLISCNIWDDSYLMDRSKHV